MARAFSVEPHENHLADFRSIGGVVPLQEVLSLLDLKPDHVELVLTGRRAPQAILDRADLVTEMVEVKHPFREGLLARKGIDH